MLLAVARLITELLDAGAVHELIGMWRAKRELAAEQAIASALARGDGAALERIAELELLRLEGRSGDSRQGADAIGGPSGERPDDGGAVPAHDRSVEALSAEARDLGLVE